MALTFAAPKNVTTFQQMLGYINGLTDVGGNGGVLGILFLIIIGAALFLMTKGYGTKRAFGVTGLVIGFLSIILRAMILIPAGVMYVCIFLAVFGIITLLGDAAKYEN